MVDGFINTIAQSRRSLFRLCYSVDKSIYHYDSVHDDLFLDCVIVLINPSIITIAVMTIPSLTVL
jgi:hypothetical protein